MSIPNWMNDAQAFPSGDHGSFNPNGHPSVALMQTPTNPSFDFNQLQNPQLQQQRMQNGSVRNGSPGYNNSVYQTQPMIPSKRPRPREDSIGASPQQNSETLPNSRSQTPQAPYQGFQGAVNGAQQLPGSAPYQQFQQPSSHASPSPVVQNQSFAPQVHHQRVQTMSPSPFSPATQSFARQVSPPQPEHGSRVNTPQNGGPQYAQGMPYSGTPSQSYTPPVGPQVNGAGLAQYNQHFQTQNQHQQQHHHHHHQQQLRMNELRMRQMQQQRQQASALNPLGQPANQSPAHQMAAFRTQPTQETQQRPNNPAHLLRNIQHWAQQQGQQFNPQPIIAGRATSSIQLFITVMRMGGSRKVTSQGHWQNVAAFLQFQGQQQMVAAQELQSYWQTSLAGYEHFFTMQQQQRRAMGDPARAAIQSQMNDAGSRQDAFSPTRQMHSQPPQQLMQPPHMQVPFNTPTKSLSLSQNDPRQSLQNGYFNPQQAQGPGRPSNVYNMPQSMMQGPQNTVAQVEVQRVPPSKVPKRPPPAKKSNPWPTKIVLSGTEFVPEADFQEAESTVGGIQLGPGSPFLDHTVEDLLKYKLSIPKIEELGLVDISALMLSLRSGIYAEVRLALDTLASLSKDGPGFLLENCEDLLETLIDCADDQVQLLVDSCAEVSDEMMINSYEETIRGCKTENATLQEFPEFGTLDHDLDRAADRLICVTTIIRNLSSFEVNRSAIATRVVTQFMATVVRYIGTRSMLLRTHRNTLDFSKDILSILANVSHFIDLPGKEEALWILHFLLSFAPSPAPSSHDDEGITFASYLPGVHRYYPHAVDTLAKLLARGDPNRTYFRLIFASDSNSPTSSDLLTRSFGLAIAALPEMGSLNPGRLIKVRLPFLLQGLLAAEILASLMPSTDHKLARSWLASQDGFASSLMRIVTELGQQSPQPPPPRQVPGRMSDPDPFGYATITEHGFGILRKLTEKAKDAVENGKEMPHGVFPNRQSVIAALKIPNLSSGITKQLCALSNLDT